MKLLRGKSFFDFSRFCKLKLQTSNFHWECSLVLLRKIENKNKKRKVANSFRNTSYENKPSKVVKPINSWLTKRKLELSRTSMMEHFYENS